MKVKSLEKVNFIIILFLIFLLVIHSSMYVYTTEGMGISYFDFWLLSESIGFTSFFICLVSLTQLGLPSNFYKTNGDTFLFYNNNIDVLVKLIVLISSLLLIGLGMYLSPENAFTSKWRGNSLSDSWFEFIVAWFLIILFAFTIVFVIVSFFVSWWKNKNDKITLDANQIHCFDTEHGEKKINLKTIQEIEFSDESILFKGTENVTIDLSLMSLQVFKGKIEEELTRLCPDIKITVIPDSD